jgi:hypothetical protein
MPSFGNGRILRIALMVASVATCSDKPHWVYVLRDPRDNRVKYIGCSTKPVKRFKDHLSFARMMRCSNCKTFVWLNGLMDSGLIPTLEIVSDAMPLAAAYKFELDLITAFLKNGIDLHQTKGASRNALKLIAKGLVS